MEISGEYMLYFCVKLPHIYQGAEKNWIGDAAAMEKAVRIHQTGNRDISGK